MRPFVLVVSLALTACAAAHGGEADGATSALDAGSATDTGATLSDAAGVPVELPLPDEGRDALYGPGVFVDLDGDGLDEIVLSNFANRGDTTPYRGGGVAILYGRRDRSSSPTDGMVEILGPPHQTVAQWLAPGDYDGDGIDDLAIGSPGYSTDFGSLHVLYGSHTRLEGRLVIEDVAPAIVWTGMAESPVTFPSLGARAGDVDGDGRDDLVIAHEHAVSAGGVAYLLLGRSTRWADLDGVSPDATFTLPLVRTPFVTSGGDLDGDGHPDLFVGDRAPDGNGIRVGVFYGPVALGTHALDEADAHITSSSFNAFGGQDADGDGLDDLAFSDGSAPAGTPVSRSLHVFLGSHTRLTGDVALSSAPIEIMPVNDGDGLGASFAVGDYDGDGHPDVVVGSPYADARAGRVELLIGPLRSRSVTGAERTWRGTASTDDRGVTVGQAIGFGTALGDFDGDGLDDLIFGGEIETPAGPRTATYLVFGTR